MFCCAFMPSQILSILKSLLRRILFSFGSKRSCRPFKIPFFFTHSFTRNDLPSCNSHFSYRYDLQMKSSFFSVNPFSHELKNDQDAIMYLPESSILISTRTRRKKSISIQSFGYTVNEWLMAVCNPAQCHYSPIKC